MEFIASGEESHEEDRQKSPTPAVTLGGTGPQGPIEEQTQDKVLRKVRELSDDTVHNHELVRSDMREEELENGDDNERCVLR